VFFFYCKKKKKEKKIEKISPSTDAHLNNLFLRRKGVDDLDEASFLRQDSHQVAVVLPPRSPKVVGPGGVWVRRRDVHKATVGAVRNHAACLWVYMGSDLKFKFKENWVVVMSLKNFLKQIKY
jgi:hypothetical protein